MLNYNNNIDSELSNLLENLIQEQVNYNEIRKALIEEIRNIEKIGNAMGRKLRYFEDIINFSEINSIKDADDFLKDALRGDKYASIYVTGFSQDGDEKYQHLEDKEINELKNMLKKGLIHKDLFYIVNDWIYFELRLKSSVLNEATIVNKFKKEMHLFNVGRSSRDMLEPNYESAGNRLERQSGKAIFFFSTMDEAIKYAVARGIELAWKEFWEFSVVPCVQGIKDENVYNEVADYCNILRKILVGGKLPPIYFAYGVHMKYYGLDDKEVYPRFPLCNIFAKYLANSKIKLYIRECIVDTKDIKHGHSADFKEFTVFKSCPVYKNHEITLGDAFKKMQITYLTTTDDFLKYPSIINDTKKDKDWFRKFIQHKDEYKLKFLQMKQQKQNTITESADVVKNVEVEVIYGDWEADITVWEVGNDITPLHILNIDLPKKFHSDSPDEYWKGKNFNAELLEYAKKKIMPIAIKKGFKIHKIFLH